MTGTTITTASGFILDLANPGRDAIWITDMAAGLGHVCRFAGQGKAFYSVAEHSCLGAEHLGRLGGTPLDQLQFLLHDAHEAYTGDLSTPLKHVLGEGIGRVQARLQVAILEALGVPPPDAETASLIRQADAVLAATEYAALFDHAPPWNGPGVPSPHIRLSFWPPTWAPLRWLAAYDRLRAAAQTGIGSPQALRHSGTQVLKP